jgi:SAM-dependent methyltransferase
MTMPLSRADVSIARSGRWQPTVASLSRRLYPDVLRRDPVAAFVDRLTRSVRPDDRVLDLGAGAGELNTYALKGRVRQLVGVDLDPRVADNPLLDVGLQADIGTLPFADASFDVVFSIYVLEHVERPDALAAEIARVLRPGGVCLSLTPNVFHYVTAISRLTPTRFHRRFNAWRGRPAEDTFETFYRFNSRGALVRHFGGAGLTAEHIDTIEVQPNYLTFSVPTYVMGVAYERLVNATELLSPIRVNLLATFRKPARDSRASRP